MAIAVIAVVAASLVAVVVLPKWTQPPPQCYVGVEYAYSGAEDLKLLVDKVKDFTNLFVIGVPEISLDQKTLNATCDYIYAAGLHFIILFTSSTSYDYVPYVWIIKAREKYGERFLGVYRYDEPGGNQLDKGATAYIHEAENYSDAAEKYVDRLSAHIEYYAYASPRVFTADYGLYWFDYEVGYDVVLAEFGMNHSRAITIALCRGAASAHSKEWGVIVTWTYTQPPYIAEPEQFYDDLTKAYHSGAKYIVVFNYPKTGTYGILTEAHFDALRRFWNYMKNNPHTYGQNVAKVAYILPKDYGFGFRHPDDTIWGLWPADELSEKIWKDANMLTKKHGFLLDILYEDTKPSLERYTKRYFWNETLQEAD
jgi:hypothetical protein